MRQLALVIALLLAITIYPKNTYAEATSATSAALTPQEMPNYKATDIRVKALEAIFKKYNSPLLPYAETYVTMADKYGVEWKLLPAIAGLESSFGKAFIHGTYNVYGWGSGTIYFKSWENGIETITKALKENYMGKWKATDVWSIGRIYAESPTWAIRVNHFMNEINNQFITFDSKSALKPTL